MDFSIPSEMEQLLESVAAFLEDEVYPLEAEALGGSFVAAEPRLEELRRKVREKGWWLPQIPREHGGMGLTVQAHGLLSGVLGRSPLGHYVFGCQAPDAGNMEILLDYGTEAQKERFLGPLLSGEIRSCFAMTEPDSPGSNPVILQTLARRDGDEYVIDGHKWFTSSADGAAFAVVMAVTDPQGPRHRRASQILVPTDTPGYTRVRNVPVLGHAGDGWASHAEVRLEECRVPRENLLGEEGAGFAIAQARLGPGRIHHCMRWIGVCERALDLLCRRAAHRELSPGEVLGEKQTIQNWIAESRAEIHAARLAVLHAAWRIDQVGSKEARDEIAMIKFHVAGILQKVVDRAVQTHGALGLTDLTVLSWFFTQERGARIYDGPDEVHKAALARRTLERYGARVRR